jgi:hypothetical protein
VAPVAAAALLISLLSPDFAFAQSATSTTVTSSINPATFNQSETFTATVTSGSTVNESVVLFFNDGNAIPGCGPVPVNNGVATCTTTVLVGSHTILAAFIADANFQTSSMSLTQTVNPMVTTSQSIATVTLTQGHAAGSFTPVTASGGTGSSPTPYHRPCPRASTSIPAPAPSPAPHPSPP